jgi:hypothetical protein
VPNHNVTSLGSMIRRAFEAEPIALIVGAIGGVIAAGYTLYITFWWGAAIYLVPGSRVSLLGYKTIGVPCVLINTGGRPGVITRITATLESGYPLEERRYRQTGL